MRGSLIGNRFGKLLVIEKTDLRNKQNFPIYKCICDCGKEHFAPSNQLNAKVGTRSCGCSRRISKLRLPYGESSARSAYRTYKIHAKERNLIFELSYEDFKELTKQNCYYCGIIPKQRYKMKGNSYGEYIYNGIDRIDNTVGYIKENCVPCCGRCNRAKDIWHQTNFLRWVKSIYEKHHLEIWIEKSE